MVSQKKKLSQVFLTNQKLINQLIERSSISQKDLVLEIGPGEGNITRQLVPQAGEIITVEKDPQLATQQKEDFSDTPQVKIIQADILQHQFPTRSFKIFSNIPFSIEGELIRKILNLAHPPLDSYLVMRRKITRRMAGVSYQGQFYILHSPWFEFEIFHHFQAQDFKPQPKVKASMLRFQLRQPPLLPSSKKTTYRKFIKQAFGGGGRIKQNLSAFFSGQKLNRLSQNLGFSLKDKPTDLTLPQWLKLFSFYTT